VLNAIFGDLHVVLCGDLCQHQPVGSHPLFAEEGRNMSLQDRIGINVYRQHFDRVVYLQQQQRIQAAGDYLFQSTRLFIGEQQADYAAVEQLCDRLQAKVVDDLPALAPRVPRVVCLHNAVRMRFNWVLASMHARHLGVRPICWHTRTEMPAGRGKNRKYNGAPKVVCDAVGLLTPEDTKTVAGVQYYFPGCKYLFINNDAPVIGYVNNGEAIGRGILLHESEHDKGQGDVHWLKRPPVAVFVEPKDAPVKRAAWLSLEKLMPMLPENCVPVVSGRTDSFAVKVPDPEEVDCKVEGSGSF
jgi:hypothetical protein